MLRHAYGDVPVTQTARRRIHMKKRMLMVAVAAALITLISGMAVAGPSMDRILKNGQLTVGLSGNQPPLNAKNKDGKIIGMDASLAELIALEMGVKLKMVEIPFAELLPALEAGKVDMVLSGMSMTPRRNLKVAFVGPYYVSGKGVLTKISTITKIQDAEGLDREGIKVTALKDSTSQKMVQDSAPKAAFTPAESYDEAIQMLISDKVDVVIADYPFCALTAFRNKDKGLAAGDVRLTFEPLGIAVSEDALLINWLENFLMVIEENGALDVLKNHWFNEKIWMEELP
jgi:polar amino acid transport system substrate-binding protein